MASRTEKLDEQRAITGGSPADGGNGIAHGLGWGRPAGNGALVDESFPARRYRRLRRSISGHKSWTAALPL